VELVDGDWTPEERAAIASMLERYAPLTVPATTT
jgi:hypothetical protein